MAMDGTITVAARLDRLPPSRHTRRLVTLISLGGWFEFYDLFFTAYIAIGLFKAGLFKPTTQGLFDLQGFASFVAALFLGLFIGTIAFSWLSDRFGRRSIFTFALLWYSVGAFIMAFQNTPEKHRSVAAHRQHRARRRTGQCRHLCVGAGAEGASAGRPSPITSSSCSPPCRSSPSSPGNWCRRPFSASTAGAGWSSSARSAPSVIWWIRRRLPESPRWLEQHGRTAEAEAHRRGSGKQDPRRRRQSCRRRKPSPAKPSARPAPGWRCGTRPIAAAPSCW